MTSPTQRSALGALDQARPPIARLDLDRHPEDNAADILEGWSATETALRALLGAGSAALGGQALIRELRQRGMLSLDQAHALVDFYAANDRAHRTDYRPNANDIASARGGLQQLEAALTVGPAPATTRPSPATPPPPAASSLKTTPAAVAESATPPATVLRRRPVPVTVIGVVVAVLVALGIGAYFLFFAHRGAGAALERGREAFAAGNRVIARNEFANAAKEDPTLAEPHIYLGRMAREEGEMETARRELTKAVELEPNNALAQRELGAFLLATGNLDLARKFYTRALEIDPTDKNAMGFLGCTLVRLGNVDLGRKFLDRAGQGTWSACAAMAQPAGVPPGTTPGARPARGAPAPAPVPPA